MIYQFSIAAIRVHAIDLQQVVSSLIHGLSSMNLLASMITIAFK